MRNTLLVSTAVLALTLGLGTAQAAPKDTPVPGSKSEAMSATKDKLNHAVGVVSAEMTTRTNGFVTAAAMTDMYEVQAAKIAEQRSHNAKVQNFAKAMETAHTKTTDELKSLLASERINVALPIAMDTRHQSLIDDLQGAKDADFDARYISQQIDIHNEALILLRGYHKSGDNKSLQKFAGNVENAVKMHIGMATKVQKALEIKEDKRASR